jgi:hypothetical protein
MKKNSQMLLGHRSLKNGAAASTAVRRPLAQGAAKPVVVREETPPADRPALPEQAMVAATGAAKSDSAPSGFHLTFRENYADSKDELKVEPALESDWDEIDFYEMRKNRTNGHADDRKRFLPNTVPSRASILAQRLVGQVSLWKRVGKMPTLTDEELRLAKPAFQGDWGALRKILLIRDGIEPNPGYFGAKPDIDSFQRQRAEACLMVVPLFYSDPNGWMQNMIVMLLASPVLRQFAGQVMPLWAVLCSWLLHVCGTFNYFYFVVLPPPWNGILFVGLLLLHVCIFNMRHYYYERLRRTQDTLLEVLWADAINAQQHLGVDPRLDRRAIRLMIECALIIGGVEPNPLLYRLRHERDHFARPPGCSRRP